MDSDGETISVQDGGLLTSKCPGAICTLFIFVVVHIETENIMNPFWVLNFRRIRRQTLVKCQGLSGAQSLFLGGTEPVEPNKVGAVPFFIF